MQLPVECVELIFEHEVWAYDIDIGMIEQFLSHRLWTAVLGCCTITKPNWLMKVTDDCIILVLKRIIISQIYLP